MNTISTPWPVELEPEEVRRRLANARRAGRPKYPWPDIPEAAWRSGLVEIEGLVRAGLAGEEARIAPRPSAEARALGIAGFTSGMGPLLGWWIEIGQILAEGEIAELFGAHLAHGRARAERLERTLSVCCGALRSLQIEPMVIKSAHTARTYFPDPGTRPASDVDVVVPANLFERAEDSLADAGFERTGAGVSSPRRSDWLAPGSARLPRSLELTHVESPYTVDLHSCLDRNFLGHRIRLPPPASTSMGDGLGASVEILEHPTLLALHALHISEGLSDLTLIRLVELILMVRADRATGTLDFDEFLDLLRQIDATGFVYPALCLCERLAPGTFEPGVVQSAKDAAPPGVRRRLEGLAPSDAANPTQVSLSDSFMWCVSPSDFLRRLARVLFPASTPGELSGIYMTRAYRLLGNRVSIRD